MNSSFTGGRPRHCIAGRLLHRVNERIICLIRSFAQTGTREPRLQYEVPSPQELPERLDAVLQVIYFVFSEGYSAAAGAEATRAELTGEAIRLSRLLS
jgi:predicted RNA polymerase sigma factor